MPAKRLVSRAYRVRWTIEAVVKVPAELGVGADAEDWATDAERLDDVGVFRSTTESVDRELDQDEYAEAEQ